MQIAKVTATLKKGNHNDIGKYRPTYILSVFSRALEKIIHIYNLTKFSDKFTLEPTRSLVSENVDLLNGAP